MSKTPLPACQFNSPVSNNLPTSSIASSLIAAASPLLSIMSAIRNAEDHSNIELLRTKLLYIIQNFEAQTKAAGYSERTILAARYCLCTAIDEAVLSTQWGRNSLWSNQSLLATIHKETWGGEKFYIILEKMSQEKNVETDLLQLFYLILSLGYEGKYYNDKHKIIDVKNNLFEKIITNHEEPTLPFSPYPKPPSSLSNKKHFIPAWTLILIASTLVLIFNFITETYTNKLTHQNVKNILQYEESNSEPT